MTYGRARGIVVLFSAGLLGLGACASQSGSQKTEDVSPGYDTSYRPGEKKIHFGDEDDDRSGMAVQAEHGVLEQGDVDRVLEGNGRTFTRCYERGGDTQRYVGGQVSLKFLVDPAGKVQDVLVQDSTLGNYAIERCLVVEARRLQFPAPRGGKTAEFEYSLAFRSSGEMSVVDWSDDAIKTQINPLMAQLSPCPPLGPEAVTAVIYIEPNGQVSSAGLASSGPVDPEAGVCALEQVRRWRLNGDNGHVIRGRFQLRVPGAAQASADPSPSRVAPRKAKRRR